VAQVRIQAAASFRLDDIYRYTRDRWGVQQADRYITELFAAFDRIASHRTASHPIPAAFGVEGYFFATSDTLSIGGTCLTAPLVS